MDKYIVNPLKTIKMETVKTEGILKSVGNAVKANVNGTMFRTCTVDINGKVYFAKIWEKSFQKYCIVSLHPSSLGIQMIGDKK